MTVTGKFAILLGAVLLASTAYYLFSTDRSAETVLIGTVDANEVIVSPQVQGRIQRLAVEEGTHVKAGDLLALLDPSELETERRAAAAAILSLRHKISEAGFTARSTSGSTGGDVANARARLDAARAQLSQAQATLRRVESASRRTIALAREGIASDQDRVQAEADLTAQQAAVAAAEDQAASAQADLLSAEARTNQGPAARSEVASLRAQLASAEAQLKEAEVRLGYTRILSPVTGVVATRAAREGEVVSPGSPIVTVVDWRDTWVQAAVPETEGDRVGLGARLRIRLPGGRETAGEVFYKAAEEDFATQRDVGRRKRDIKALLLKVRLDNPEGAYVPGMTAEVLLPPVGAKP